MIRLYCIYLNLRVLIFPNFHENLYLRKFCDQLFLSCPKWVVMCFFFNLLNAFKAFIVNPCLFFREFCPGNQEQANEAEIN